MAMKKLVEYVAQTLVEEPDKVVVEETDEPDSVHLTLEVAEPDKGKVIGKAGKVIKAIRQLLTVEGTKANRKVFLNID